MIIFSFGKQNYQKGKAVNLLDVRQGPGLKNGQEADLKVCQESDLTMGAKIICGESDLVSLNRSDFSRSALVRREYII
jgi:hypothetical protein